MKEVKGCCIAPESGKVPQDRDQVFLNHAMAVLPAATGVQQDLRAPLRPVPGGIFEMGTRRSTYAADLDSPRRKVKVSPFLISPYAVTNREFARFVGDTGYRTVAEQEGWSFVFHLLLQEPARWPRTPPGLPWWRVVEGAMWSAPEGPGSDVSARQDHPAVHIAWYDALAYCRWSGLSLPREAQWERAARGGLARMKFPWGDSFLADGKHQANTFQGDFPNHDTGEDGWIGTAPVDTFAPNGYGLYNMTGNVWEWVNDRFGPLPEAKQIPPLDPTGAPTGYPRVQRGGSYLCHKSYCDRYHVHSRTRNDPDSTTGNCGFRVAVTVLPE